MSKLKKERYKALKRFLAAADEAYYGHEEGKAASPLTDSEYDALKIELRQLEQQLQIVGEDKIGDDRVSGFAKKRHLAPMLSLENAFNAEDLAGFLSRVFAAASDIGMGPSDVRFMVEPKIDGLALSLRYSADGRLISAVTRGDGLEGDDVTTNVGSAAKNGALIRGLEAFVTPQGQEFEVRGEVYLTFERFRQLNQERQQQGLPLYANPRNLATGTLKLRDPDEVARRGLSFRAHGWFWPWLHDPASVLCLLADEGFALADDRVRMCHGFEVEQAVAEAGLEQRSEQFPFPTDGAVIKVADMRLRRYMGEGTKCPRWAIAYKFAAERALTRVNAITMQVGRTGNITPVAELEPVVLSGSTVRRATLHNEDEIARKDVREGDMVWIEKAGEIIPAVVEVDLSRRPPFSKPFVFAEAVKAAGIMGAQRPEGQVAWTIGRQDTPHRRKLALLHFARRDAMDIENLGEAVAAQLVDTGLVQTPADLFRLTVADLLTLERMGEKSATNLHDAIQGSLERDFWRVLHGCGIPLVGTTTSKDLARTYRGWEGLLTATLEDLQTIEGIGETTAEAVYEWLSSEAGHGLVLQLLAHGIGLMRSGAGRLGPWVGLTFVMTGSLPTLDRLQAQTLVEEAGGRSSGSVSKKTSFVVAGEAAGSKLAKARQLGIPVIDEAELLAALRDARVPRA